MATGYYTKADAEEYFGSPVELTHEYFEDEDYTQMYWTRIRKDGFALESSVKADMDEFIAVMNKFLEVTND